MAEKKRKVRGSKTQKAASRDDMPNSNKSTTRSGKQRKPRGTPSTAGGPRKPGGQMKLVHQWVSRTLTLGVKGLREEFNAMPRGVPNDMIRVFVANGLNGKNRYKDVPCIDSTRVAVAKTQDGNDYIHANYVETPSSEHRFICTQGPLEKTANDFWAMVLQEKSRVCPLEKKEETPQVILMLCNFIEKNANKCYEYFPQSEGERKTFGNITVTNGKMVTMPLPRSPVKIVIRALQIERGDERHVADHYHWVDWPDRGVPPADMSAIALVDKIRVTTSVPSSHEENSYSTPIIVHCSAGIGRTGSIVLIEYTLETLLAGKEIRNMNELLTNLRKQRAASVQTDLQVLLEYFRQNQFVDATGNIQAYLERFKTDYVRATT